MPYFSPCNDAARGCFTVCAEKANFAAPQRAGPAVYGAKARGDGAKARKKRAKARGRPGRPGIRRKTIQKMNNQVKGYACAAAAAVSYGLNPLCALFLYQDGLTAGSVLFYRFAFAAALLALLLLVQRKSFRVTAHEAAVLAVLGLLFAVSSITYFVSFHYIAAGVASTIVFMYPVMVALIMALFFHERLTRPMLAAIVLTLGGIGLLYRGDGSGSLSPAGVGLALVSALTYALYIIVVNRSRLVMSGVKLTFYALLVCLAGIALFALCSGEPLQPLPSAHAWFFALLLGLVPTVVSLVTMAVAIRCIGSTPTAVMGALEPVTALAVGTLVFSEPFGASQAAGVGAILLAVTAVVAGRSLRHSPVVGRVLRAGRYVWKHWRWR